MIFLRPAMGGQFLTGSQLLIIANSSVPESMELARYYARLRKIPETHIISLNLPDRESISRKEYDKLIARPLKRELMMPGWATSIRCLLLCYGIPLKVAGRAPTEQERQKAKVLTRKINNLKKQLEEIKKTEKTGTGKKREQAEAKTKINRELKQLRKRRAELLHSHELASVDSELSLIKIYPDYPTADWLPNPFFIPNVRQPSNISIISARDYLLVSRIDGPNPAIARRIVRDAVATEKNGGLRGTAYIDCRYPPAKIGTGKKLTPYQRYDKQLRQAAKVIEQHIGKWQQQAGKSPIIRVVTDNSSRLFQPGTCHNAAIYSGWYSLRNYIDAFDFVQGAVAWHIASGECVSLRKRNRQWCRMLLIDGACATLGPVAEPYLQSFPLPHLFYGLLLDGRFSLAEVFHASKPWTSWRQVLIGDPLYRPFGKMAERQWSIIQQNKSSEQRVE